MQGPQRQPAALLPKIIAKLKEMEKEGHLAKVSQPTDWVNSTVVSSQGEKIRICLDPGDLNKAVKREQYAIPTVKEITVKIPDAKVFTVLDAKSGYLQMKLDYESSLLTTMNTPTYSQTTRLVSQRYDRFYQLHREYDSPRKYHSGVYGCNQPVHKHTAGGRHCYRVQCIWALP